jgi:type IV secretory pathway TrbL component
MDTAILTNSLNQFLTVFNAAYGLIWANGGQALLWVLAGIELVLVALWWALGSNAQIMDVIRKLANFAHPPKL